MRRKGLLRIAIIVVLLLVTASGCAHLDPVPPPQDGSEPAAVNDPRLMFGAFTTGGVWGGMEPILDLESDLGQQLDIVHWYAAFHDPLSLAMLDAASADGRTPMISWEPHSESLADIAAGKYDAQLLAWAEVARAYDRPLYLRPMEEMNTYDTPWAGDPPAFVAAWRHMVSVFRAEHARNVYWVWSPNNEDVPTNAMELYYPGNYYVDILAIDGYNWGACRPWSHWQSFTKVFANAYDRVSALGPQAIWIAEFGSTESGGDKAAWIRSAFQEVGAAFPRIKAVVYFDHDEAGTCGWSINSSRFSLDAFRQALHELMAIN